MALTETLSGTDTGELRDEYREALEKVIAAKAAGTRPRRPKRPHPPPRRSPHGSALAGRGLFDVEQTVVAGVPEERRGGAPGLATERECAPTLGGYP
ncbi:hypothetical protein [Streptomyces sp. NPDC056401]|uniref:hypothetical protein n=1 Tax=Streptomyces sp. NPDC056401 TaxID=3345809 RepID=UPI0035E27EE0